MDALVYLAVLVAALLHAAWNSLVKSRGDHFSVLLMLTITHASIGALGLLAVPAPSTGAIPWIAAGAILHTGYKVFLAQAYAHADLSQAYPLARGTAPLLVFVISVYLFGEVFRPIETAGVLAISLGILYMAYRGEHGTRMPLKSLGWAVGTAAFISGYTIVGGNGARIAGTPSGFLFWLVIGDAFGMAAWALWHRGTAAFSAIVPVWKIGAVAGAMSLFAYWIVMWAFTVAPIALVAALRESSILFATVFGAFILREHVNSWRWISAGLIVIGMILLNF